MKYSRIRLKFGIIAACIGVLTSGMAASAFFTDSISYEAAKLKTSEIRLSYPEAEKPEGLKGMDFSIIVDMGGHDMRIVPYQQGESIELTFRTYVSSDRESIMIPKLEAITERFPKDGSISVFQIDEDGRETALGKIEEEKGSSFFYGSIGEADPGTEITFRYRVCLEKLPKDHELVLDFGFAAAAIQKYGNEGLLIKDTDPEEAYELIREKYNGSDSMLLGFTDLRDLRDAVTSDGRSGTEITSKHVPVRLFPNISDEGSGITDINWYLIRNGEVSELPPEADGSLKLMINEANAGSMYRYMVSSRAGSITSDDIRIDYNDGDPVLR